ncbi:trypsin-like peptidase domain-containing protein [Streptomyces sp. LE64]|uniref:trypsin-like peptidase domain-containing protein n=1 Tax=Streptomyces sp. LE64 TaxID=3448653 RepID=UPI004042C1B5
MAAGGGVRAASLMETPRWAVRLRRANGDIVGTGILLSPDRVLTCAHVVDSANGPITAEFVGAAAPDVPSVPARVDEGAYVQEDRDLDGDPGGDLALLELERPRPAADAVRLHRLSSRREVRMYGFPRGHNGGIWFRALAVGGCGRDGQVQLAPTVPGEVAGPGFSGAGVADGTTGEVFGMVLTRHPDGHCFMAPAETIVRHLPQVQAFTVGPTAVDDRLRSTGDDVSADLLDEPFAQRLAEWLRDDGRQVKISVVGPDDRARAATLRRAVSLADRERPAAASAPRSSWGPPATVPSIGGYDLAVDAAGLECAEIAGRIAGRLGLPPCPEGSVSAALRAARSTLDLVVVGVDEAVDPSDLLDLLEVLRAGGSRLLLVFRTAGVAYLRAREELVVRPARERRARLVERLEEVTGPLARALHQRRAEVLPHGLRSVDAYLVAAHAALADLTRTPDDPARLPDLARYERLAERAAAGLSAHAERLDLLRERCDELGGRLRGYRVLHQHAAQGVEDPAVDALYLRAHALLQTRPCDVREAEAAVAAYTHRVDGTDASARDRGGAPR